MERIDVTAPRAIVLALNRQPTTAGKVLFAWTLSAGAPLARAARASWHDGVLYLDPRTATWRRELVRARPTLLGRLGGLLGPDAVRTIVITGTEDAR